MKNKQANIVLILFFFVISLEIFSQNIPITNYTREDGLPERIIYDAAQDESGVMWFATETGIMSYDGSNWEMLNETKSVKFYKIIKTKENGLIFLPKKLENNIVLLKNKKVIERLKDIPITENSNLITADFYDKRELLALGLDKKFILYDKIEKSIKFSETFDELIVKIKFHKNKIFICTTKRIWVYDQKNYDQITSYKYSDTILTVNFESNVLYVLFENKILKLNESFECLDTYNNFDLKLNAYINVIFKDLIHINDYLYFGHTEKLFRLNLETKKIISLNKFSGLISEGITSLFKDYEKNVWITNFRGINKINNSPIINYFNNNEVSVIIPYKNRMLLGYNHGYGYFKGEKKLDTKNEKNNNYTRILNFTLNTPEDFYAVVNPSELYKFKKGKFKRISKFPNVTTIEKIGSEFYLGTPNFLIVTNENLEVKKKIKAKNTYFRKIVKIYQNIFFCSQKGTFKYSKDKIKKIPLKDSSIENSYDLHKFKNEVFLADKSGFYVLNDSIFVKQKIDGKFINEPVYFIENDNQGRVYLGTDNGVLIWYKNDDRAVRYNKSNGLSGNETNRAAHYFDDKGNFWVGTAGGLSKIDISSIDTTKYIPKVKLINLELQKGKNYDSQLSHVFEPDQNNLKFNFRGLSFIDESKNKYVAKLEKIDDEWSQKVETKNDFISFYNLSYGNYQFSVQVINADGLVSKPAISGNIEILRPFYLQYWFIISNLLVLVIIIYFVNDYLTERKYRKQLELDVKERTKSLEESENLYRSVVENSFDAVILTNSKNQIQFCNEQTKKYFLLTKFDSLFKKDLKQFIAYVDLEKFEELNSNLKKYGYCSDEEIRVLRSDGSNFTALLNAKVINSDTEYNYIVYALKDITLFKVAEEKMKTLNLNLEEKLHSINYELRELLNQSPFYICVFNDKGYIEDYNSKFIKDISYVQGDNNLDNYNFLRDEIVTNSKYYSEIKNVFEDGEFFYSSHIQVKNLKRTILRDKSIEYIKIRLYGIYDNDKSVKKVVCMIENSTEQKLAEETELRLLEQKNKTSFILNAIEEERKRISRDLHDGLGQIISGIKLKIEAYEIQNSVKNKNINEISSLLEKASNEIRTIIGNLHPIDIDRFGLPGAVENLIFRLNKTSNIKFIYSLSDKYSGEIPKEIEISLYRILQEAINNTLRHSKAKNCSIKISRENGSVFVFIEDDGKGFFIEKKDRFNGFGIKNIYHRCELINAELSVDTKINEGTRIKVSVPISQN